MIRTGVARTSAVSDLSARLLAGIVETRAGDVLGPCIAGVDEAGRGPLAGPLLVAAVVLGPAGSESLAAELDDSKRLSPQHREDLALRIRQEAAAWSVWRVSARQIDRLGILGAVDLGMRQAAIWLRPRPDAILIDGNRVPPGLPVPGRAVVDGDRLAATIMAASILAKTVRDREMERWDRVFPGYGFAAHRGYGTARHWACLERLGPSPIHRQSFLGRYRTELADGTRMKI